LDLKSRPAVRFCLARRPVSRRIFFVNFLILSLTAGFGNPFAWQTNRAPGVKRGHPGPLKAQAHYLQRVKLREHRRWGVPGAKRHAGKVDGSAKSPVSALRCISKSLRRKYVRLAPLRFARRSLNFFRNRLVFDFLPVHQG
jgi:hypothetical protein